MNTKINPMADNFDHYLEFPQYDEELYFFEDNGKIIDEIGIAYVPDPEDARRAGLIRQPALSLVNEHLIEYPTPSNINYLWGFGSLAGLFLVVQIATGIFLAMHYTPHVDLAFSSVEHIMRDVEGGWLLRYAHANGASMFFIIVYMHMFRGLYYGSYASPREAVWCIGVIILLLMIITAFIGYVLPWGQMSFWGATVITSLASAIPIVGDQITFWLWGGFSVDNATLNRFFSLHYLLPFIIAGASIAHIAALHQYGSNNPLGTLGTVDKVPFYPYFYVKDLVGWVAFFMFYSAFLFFAPNDLGHPDNYIPANPMVTPAHIVPEWYFLPVYAILRSIPNKLGGVLAIALVFVSLLALPFINSSEVRSSSFRPLHKVFFWLLVSDCIILGWIGQKPVEEPYVTIGQLASVYFFVYFLVIMPVLGNLENYLVVYPTVP
jgi:ubiquinol-cytochrome c reductase cytochrome b subunit